MCPCCCYLRAPSEMSALGGVWQLTQFAAWKRRSGLNRIGHPDWVKLSVELNCAPNQNTKFSFPYRLVENEVYFFFK